MYYVVILSFDSYVFLLMLNEYQQKHEMLSDKKFKEMTESQRIKIKR